ncbi:MAG TPA: hypothetical protein VI386_25435 [Candidatus Sulfotelmatobacter sp.]
MAINNEKVDEMTMAFAVPDDVQGQAQAEGLEDAQLGCPRPLTPSGYIHEPTTKSKSVMLTDEDLFEKHFITG